MKGRLVALSLMAFACAGVGTAIAQPNTSILEGVFTAEQAQRGSAAYKARCSECHGGKLISADGETASLTGPAFNFNWRKKTVAEKFELIFTTMPDGKVGSLDDQTYIDIIAFILQFNGYPAGDAELAADIFILDQIVIVPLP